MPTDDRYPQRKSPRLRQFDYSSRNYYFITICTKDKKCLFGTPTALSGRPGKSWKPSPPTIPARWWSNLW